MSTLLNKIKKKKFHPTKLVMLKDQPVNLKLHTWAAVAVDMGGGGGGGGCVPSGPDAAHSREGNEKFNIRESSFIYFTFLRGGGGCAQQPLGKKKRPEKK